MGNLLLVTMLAAALTPSPEPTVPSTMESTAESTAEPDPNTPTASSPVIENHSAPAAPARTTAPSRNRIAERVARAQRAAVMVSLGVVAGGIGGGAIAFFGLSAVNSSIAGVGYYIGNGVVLVSAAAFLAAAPTVMVAAFTDLPGWAPWASGAAAAGGTIAGLVTGVWLGTVFVFAVAARTGNDCIGCGPESLVGYVALPLGLAFIGGTALGITTTTLATFSE